MIEGVMIPADATTYTTINQPNQIAYLSCDVKEADGQVTPNVMLNALMKKNLRAIVLYSIAGNWCLLQGQNFEYESIFTMADSGDAAQALGFFNGTTDVDIVRVTITGNATADVGGVSSGGEGGNNSAVAMSILYSITGLITMLFLVIIATGAIRAHRYPERYGPRSGYGGRPRQSRAKGIARAVLETIPIVKFGSPEPAKPDPSYDLESMHQGGSSPQLDAQRAPSTDRSPPTERSATAAPSGDGTKSDSKDSTVPSEARQEDDGLGCSICTDDFKVGEDVRVLPCNHKYHPACIDPWLVNVSGTCPLW
jgi:hypothetical protein